MSPFSINLQQACVSELSLLRKFAAEPSLYDEAVLRNAIRRYETCWLPMQASQPNTNILPPLDVHLVWHAYMLRPHAYRKDCFEISGRVVDHKLHSDEDREALAKDSMLKWAEHNPHEPFEWKELVQIGDRVAYEQKSRYDIAAAVHRQRKFANMITAMNPSQPMLEGAVKKYEKFLDLLAAFPDRSLSPTLLIDLPWHVHQLHPVPYFADCMAAAGKLIGHNDEQGDGDNAPEKLWLEHFCEAMHGAAECHSDCCGGGKCHAEGDGLEQKCTGTCRGGCKGCSRKCGGGCKTNCSKCSRGLEADVPTD